MPVDTAAPLSHPPVAPPPTRSAVGAPPPQHPATPAAPPTAAAPAVTTTLGALAQTALAHTGTGLATLPVGSIVPGALLQPGTSGTPVAVRILPPPDSGASDPTPEVPTSETPTPGAPSAGSSAPRILSGTVTGTMANGQTLVTTPLGPLALATRTPLPPGLPLRLELLTNPATLCAQRPEATASDATPPAFAGLRELLSTFTGEEASPLHGLVNALLPQPNRRLAASLAFFLSSARRGDVRAWLGEETTATLESGGHHSLINRLDQEFRALPQRTPDPPQGDWTLFPVPFFDAGLLTRLDWYVRAAPEEEEAAGGRPGEPHQRFLLEIDLSRLGPLQLDGLVRPKRFDLILRSHTPLPEALRHNLVAVFAECLEAVGFAGTLNYQAGPQRWVKPGRPPDHPRTGRPRTGRGVIA